MTDTASTGANIAEKVEQKADVAGQQSSHLADQQSNHQTDQQMAQPQGPTLEQRQKLEQLVKQALPKQYEGYVTDTFNYAADAMNKMNSSADKQQTANEIAQDLRSKWDNFIAKREQEKKAQELQPAPQAGDEKK